MNQIPLIIFDMDGLMFDTERLAISAWQKAGGELGFNIAPDFYINTTGIKIESAEMIFRKHFGVEFPFYKVEKLKAKYILDEIETNGLPVKNGLYELINFLNQKKVLTAIATSTERQGVEKYLSFTNIRDNFDCIVSGDEVPKGKPEPDIFLSVAEKLECIPEECIVLEDSENGIIAASRAKMKPILVPDIKKPLKEIKKLIFKEFDSLLRVKDYLGKILV